MHSNCSVFSTVLIIILLVSMQLKGKQNGCPMGVVQTIKNLAYKCYLKDGVKVNKF